MLSDPMVKRHFAGETLVMVGTANADGAPACCRAVGLVAGAGPQSCTVYLPVATAAQTIANLATNGRIAVTSSRRSDHNTVQLKGRVRSVRVARDDERATVERWMEKFVAVVTALGLPRPAAEGLTHWPAFAVEVEVDAVFDQTPGPRAGAMMTRK